MTSARTFTGAAVAFLALLITGYSGAQTVRCTTWNLQWFPNGSAKEASAEQQNQRIKEAADVLRPINPDIVLLQEVRDYDACARLGEAIAPGIYSSLKAGTRVRLPYALRKHFSRVRREIILNVLKSTTVFMTPVHFTKPARAKTIVAPI